MATFARRRNIKLRVVPIDERGDLNVDTYKSLFNEHTRLVGVAHVSNVLGTINPVREMIAYAHAQGVPVLVDGAQAVPHLRVNVQELDADFYVFSAHKVYGPTGIGVLYGKEKWLDAMPPYQGGGEMIAHVDFRVRLSGSCLSSSRPVHRTMWGRALLRRLWIMSII